MTKTAIAALLSALVVFAGVRTQAEENQAKGDMVQKWLEFIQGQWDYELTVDGETTKGTITSRPTVSGRSLFATWVRNGEDRVNAAELMGRQPGAMLVTNGYIANGSHWRVAFDTFGDDFSVAGDMSGTLAADGPSHKGRVRGWRVDDNTYKYEYRGKTANGDPTKTDLTLTRPKRKNR